MIGNMGAIVANAWERVMAETPADVHHDLSDFFRTGQRLPYRERLTRKRKNMYGQPLTQTQVVRYNLRRLCKPKTPPVLPS